MTPEQAAAWRRVRHHWVWAAGFIAFALLGEAEAEVRRWGLLLLGRGVTFYP